MSKGNEKSDKKSEKSFYIEGEKLLCYHGPLIYEAKCLQVRKTDDGFEYFIHYSGWSKTWDEWVAGDRLLKSNDENLEKKAELNKDHKPTKKAKRKTSIGSTGDKEESSSRSNSPKTVSGRKSVSTAASKHSNVIASPTVSTPTTTVGTPKTAPTEVRNEKADLSRRKKDYVSSPIYERTEVDYSEHITIIVHIPDALRLLLIYDFELICRRKKVLKVPARVTVDEIAEKYISHKVTLLEAPAASRFAETVYGLKSYFNCALARKLLYSFEKPQYEKYLESKPGAIPSSIYGVVHLIRLLVKIGPLMAHMQLDEYGTNMVEENINDFIRYLKLEIGKCVNIEDYQSVSIVDHQQQRKVKDASKSRN